MPTSARYLLRFDDVCPTMNWNVWASIEEILAREGIKPILAVVPENRDWKLKVAEPRLDFWHQVRKWQSRGWTIGLHGYQHSYVTNDAGIIGLNRYSEFAGLTYVEQCEKIRRGVRIFRGNGVNPDLWIAPAHSFDGHTLKALLDAEIRTVSDGFFLYPNVDARGTLWIPQQLWDFRPMSRGVWTVCFHHNDWNQLRIDKFRDDVKRYREGISSVQAIEETYFKRSRTVLDTCFAFAFLRLLRLRGLAKAFLMKPARPLVGASDCRS